MGNQGDIPMPNQHSQNMYPMHGLQHSGSQAAFVSSIYSNMMQQTSPQPPSNPPSSGDLWYYEDPEVSLLLLFKNIFSTEYIIFLYQT